MNGIDVDKDIESLRTLLGDKCSCYDDLRVYLQEIANLLANTGVRQALVARMFLLGFTDDETSSLIGCDSGTVRHYRRTIGAMIYNKGEEHTKRCRKINKRIAKRNGPVHVYAHLKPRSEAVRYGWRYKGEIIDHPTMVKILEALHKLKRASHTQIHLAITGEMPILGNYIQHTVQRMEEQGILTSVPVSTLPKKERKQFLKGRVVFSISSNTTKESIR